MRESENMQVTVILKGKDRDIRLAEEIRQTFITEYNNESRFQELIMSLGTHTADRLIHRLNRTEKINLYGDYNALKDIAEETIGKANRMIFKDACLEEDARTWINNKGKYQEIVFESLYKVFRANEKLQTYIK